MTRIYVVTVLTFFVSFFVCLCAQEPLTIRCVWKFDQERQRFSFDNIPEQFFLSQITFSSDVPYDREEFITELGFQELHVVTREQLVHALERIHYKEKFEHVIVSFSEDPPESFDTKSVRDGNHRERDIFSCSLHFAFSSWWTVSKVRCKGSVLGKDRFRHQYCMAPGTRFDMAKHADSLISIEEQLRNEGYAGVQVIDHLDYDEERKTVSVTLYLEPGQLYTIKQVHIELAGMPADDAPTDYVSRVTKWEKKLQRQFYCCIYGKPMVQQVEQKLEELAVHDGFLQPDISIESEFDHSAQKVELHCKVQLNERRHFNFFGNHVFSDGQLLDHLLLFGKSVLLLPPSLLVDEIIDLYKSKGFWSVASTYREEQEECFFCITEGKRAKITSLSVESAVKGKSLFFDLAKYRKFFGQMLHALFFDKQRQRTGRDAMLQEYMRSGFWDCKIVSEEFLPTGIESEYTYHVVIDEGIQRTLRSVAVPQFEEIFERKAFAPYKNMFCATQFDVALVQEQRRTLLHALQRAGRLYAHPKPFLQQHAQGVIDLVWQIEHDEPVYFGQTIVAGATRLPAHCIFRELKYEPGMLWDAKKIDRSRAALKALGIFEQVILQPVPEDGNMQEKDLILTCIDDDPFELRLRLGMQLIGNNLKLSNIGARGGGLFLWKNPWNQADLLEMNAVYSPFLSNGEITYTLPWLFGRPIKTIFSVYSALFDQQLMRCFREKLYSVFQNGFQVSFEHTTDHVKEGCNIGVEWVRIGDISARLARLIDFSPRLVDKFVGFFIFEPLMLATYLDDPLNPTIGGTTFLSAKVMAPLEYRYRDTALCKIFFEQTFFVPLVYETVFAARLRIAHIFFNDFSHTMVSERFYLGGAFNLRGYNTDMAPPLNVVDQHDRLCLVPLGGKSMINGMFELRLPPLPLFEHLGWVVFTDFGVLSQEGSAFIDAHNMIGATGFGLRYATPVGPFRFDIAWKWKRYALEEGAFAWFLTMGNAF